MITKSDRRLFRQAAVMAAAGQPHVRVGVVLSQGRRPYAWECNHAGPVDGEPFLKGHAEMRVLKKARKKSTLYVARIDRAGTLMPSVPCMACATQIELDGSIRKVVYYDGHEIKKVQV